MERQLNECLEGLERERDDKMSLRRELGELRDREHLPRTPTRSNIDPAMIPCPDSPASDSSAEAKNLRDRLRNQGKNHIMKVFDIGYLFRTSGSRKGITPPRIGKNS